MTHRALLTGILLLLPLIITIWIAKFIILFITEPFLAPAHAIADQYLSTSTSLHYFVDFLLPFIVLACLFAFTCLVGAFAKNFLLRFPIRSVDRIFKRTPYIRRLYTTTYDLFKNFMKSKSNLLKHPVVIPFPNEPGRFVMGFLTSGKPLVYEDKELYPVLLPTAPHPIAGYLLFYSKEDIHCADISTEDAVRFSVSLGTLYDEKKWNLKKFH